MKLDIVFHYDVNEITGEVIYIGKDEITVDTEKKSVTKKISSTKKVDSNPDPIVTLDSNKLILTQGAVDLLQVCPDCKIDIKYKKDKGITRPVIGTDSAFNSKSGNKLTKSNTVSYRGKANEKLAEYGTTFTLEPTEDEGIYFMVGDQTPKEIVVPDEIIDIEDELDMIELDECKDFDFTL